MKNNFVLKLQSALIHIGHQVESNQYKPAPTISDMEMLFDKFLTAIDRDDMKEQGKAVKELIEGLVRWEVENM